MPKGLSNAPNTFTRMMNQAGTSSISIQITFSRMIKFYLLLNLLFNFNHFPSRKENEGNEIELMYPGIEFML